jgi:hypothetical protein
MVNLIKLNKSQLKTKYYKEYKKGDVIKVGKYFIWIDGLNTYVNTKISMVPLKIRNMPNYIKDFLGL